MFMISDQSNITNPLCHNKTISKFSFRDCSLVSKIKKGETNRNNWTANPINYKRRFVTEVLIDMLSLRTIGCNYLTWIQHPQQCHGIMSRARALWQRCSAYPLSTETTFNLGSSLKQPNILEYRVFPDCCMLYIR